MLQEFTSYLEKQLPEILSSKILVACSGGLDSMVLTQLLYKIGVQIGLAHCNFSLRGKESDGDEAFVVEQSKNFEVPVFTQVFDTKSFAQERGLSIQMAARELRYGWFEEIRKDFGYDFVVTAHHADDNLETFFINLSRGTGINGLKGIPVKSQTIVRPLLHFSREQLLQFAKDNHVLWREDSSNATRDYLRNEIRHELLPPLKKIMPTWQQNLEKTQQHLKSSRVLVDDYLLLVKKLVMEEREEGVGIIVDKLKDLPNSDKILYELLCDFGFTAWPDIVTLLTAQSGKQIHSKTHRLIKDRNVILLTEKPKDSQNFVKKITKAETQIDYPLRMSLIPTQTMGYIDNNTIYVDYNQLKFPLTLRKWKEGDRFQPFGMKGNKKLSKFFKDEKLSLPAKEAIWVLLSNNQIVWVVGYRMDDRFKITPNTNKILKIAVKD